MNCRGSVPWLLRTDEVNDLRVLAVSESQYFRKKIISRKNVKLEVFKGCKIKINETFTQKN